MGYAYWGSLAKCVRFPWMSMRNPAWPLPRRPAGPLEARGPVGQRRRILRCDVSQAPISGHPGIRYFRIPMIPNSVVGGCGWVVGSGERQARPTFLKS